MFGAGIYFAEHSSKVRKITMQCNFAIIVIIIIIITINIIIIIFRAISTCMVSEGAMVVLNTKTGPATLVTGKTLSLAGEELALI